MAQITLKIKIDLPGLKEELQKAIQEIQSKLSAVGELDIDTSEAVDEVEEVKEKVDETGKSADKTREKFAQWGQILTGLKSGFDILMGIVKNMRGMVDEAEAGELALKRLTFSFEENAGMSSEAAERSAQSFAEWASSMQAVTNFEDDIIVKSAALATQLTGLTGEGLKEFLTAAMDLATGLDMDLGAAIEKISASMEAGVPVFRGASEEYKKALQDARTENERMEISLKFIQEKFGGTAQEMKSAGKSFDNTFGDLRETAGALLSTVLVPLMEIVSAGIKGFNDWDPKIQAVTLAVGGLTVAVIAFNLAVGGWPLILGAISVALIGLVNILDEDQNGLNKQLKETGEHYEEIKEKSKPYLEAIGKMTVAQLEQAKAIAESNIQLLRQKLLQETIIDEEGTWMSTISDAVKNVLGGGITALGRTATQYQFTLTENGKILRDELALELDFIGAIDSRITQLSQKRSSLNEEEKKRLKELELIKDELIAEARLRADEEAEIHRQLQQDILNDAEDLGNVRVAAEEDIQSRLVDAMSNGKSKELAQLDLWLKMELNKYKDYETDTANVRAAIYKQFDSKRRDIDEKYQQEQSSNISESANKYQNHFNFLFNAFRSSTNSQMSVANQLKSYLLGLIQDYVAKWIATKIAEATIHATTEQTKTASTISAEVQRTAVETTAMTTQSAIALATMTALTAASVAAMTAISAAAATAATLVSIATFGGAALAGGAAVASALALIKGLSMGFKGGGFTGSGNEDEEAGVVHKEEFVFESNLVKGQASKFELLRRLLKSGMNLSDLFMGIMRQTNPMVEAPAALAGINLATPGTFGRASAMPSGMERFLSSIDKKLDKLDELANKISSIEITGKLETKIDHKATYFSAELGKKEAKKVGYNGE